MTAHVMGAAIPKCPSAFAWLEKTQRPLMKVLPVPGRWLMKQLAVRVHFFTMWRFSQRLVRRGRPDPGLRGNDISRIHWSQQLIITQTERPN
ncbi:hypothetical protein TNCV_593071 [Trichonephila clavipes]|nr:hypothetical protein TNCV_593071 [Trichonephila clavipes]